jgi:hypothetical protein
MPIRQINRIRIREDEVFVCYDLSIRPGIWAKIPYKTNDAAAPSFYRAMQGLAPVVVELCDLPPEWVKEIKVTGLSMTHSEDGVMTASISVERVLGDGRSRMEFTTPKRADAPMNGSLDYSSCLSDAAVAAIDAACHEAEAFIDGERAQMTLAGVM